MQPRFDLLARGTVRALTVLVFAAVLAPLLFFGVAAWSAYRDAYAAAEVRLRQHTRTVSEHAAKVFDTNRLLLHNVQTVLGRTDAATWRRRGAELHPVLRDLAAGLPQVRGIWVIDREGEPVASSHGLEMPQNLRLSDREYFRDLQQARGRATVVSPHLVSAATGSDIFVVAQRRERPGGRFDGLVAVSLNTDYFSAFYRELERSEPGLTIGLTRSDGAFLARLPPAPPGTWLAADGPMMQRIRAGQSTALFMNRSAVDGVTRMVAYRAIDNYPLHALAGIGSQEILRGWTRDVAVLAGFTFPLALGLALVSWVALRRVRLERVAAQEQALEADRRQKAERALHEARRLEALGRLTGGVAHDFNNLLAVVLNNLHLLRRRDPQLADSRQLGAIERAVQTGSRLTRQLLAFSRRQALRPETLDLRTELPAFMEVVRTAVAKAVSLRVEVDPHTPLVHVDKSELELALLNLTLNANDAIDGPGEIVVRAAPEPSDGEAGERRAVVSVRDSGCGIPAELLDRVVEPFFTTKEEGKGSGLGLSQVKGFVQQSGGTLAIDSVAGEFTEIRLLLPAARTALPAEDAPEETAALRLDGLRLLLVEDNPDLAASTRELLTTAGCQVEHQPTGDAARAWLQQQGSHRVDAVLSDIVMPGATSGWELADWIAREWPQLPVLLMTGYDREAKIGRERRLPVLQKPVHPGELLKALQELRQGCAA